MRAIEVWILLKCVCLRSSDSFPTPCIRTCVDDEIAVTGVRISCDRIEKKRLSGFITSDDRRRSVLRRPCSSAEAPSRASLEASGFEDYLIKKKTPATNTPYNPKSPRKIPREPADPVPRRIVKINTPTTIDSPRNWCSNRAGRNLFTARMKLTTALYTRM